VRTPRGGLRLAMQRRRPCIAHRCSLLSIPTAAACSQATGATFRVIPDKPVTYRHVRYKVTTRRLICPTELEVLDAIRCEPFDFPVALPRRE
jgi:hypothetical protein